MEFLERLSIRQTTDNDTVLEHFKAEADYIPYTLYIGQASITSKEQDTFSVVHNEIISVIRCNWLTTCNISFYFIATRLMTIQPTRKSIDRETMKIN